MYKQLVNQQNKSLLAISVALALNTNVVFAETVTPVANSEFETLEITGSRYQRSTDEILASVVVIDRSDIDTIQPQSMSDLLQTIAGVDITRQGGAGQQSSIFTRGTNSGHTLILVDGARIGSATLGATSLATIPTYQIERIEVIKGARASLYGSDAIGGVIQIFTRQLNGGEYQANVQVGSDSLQSLSGAVGVAHGNGATTLSVSHEKSDGFDAIKTYEDDDDGYDRLNIALKGQQLLSEQLTVSWLGRLDDGGYDYDTSWGGNETEYKNHVLQGKINYQQSNAKHELALSQSRDYDIAFGNGISKDDGDFFDTTKTQLAWVSQYNASDALDLSIGGDYYRENISTKTEYDNTSRDVYAVFVSGLYQQDGFISELSARYDDVEKVDSEVTYNLGIGYHFTDLFFASLNAASGFKAPSFNDLYSPKSLWTGGNADLVSETSDSVELIVRSQFGGVNTQVSVYSTDVDNLIDWAPDENGFWQPENIKNAEIDGAEVNLSKDFGSADISLGYAYVDAKDAQSGDRLDRRARHNGNVATSFVIANWQFSATYEYHGSRFDNDTKLDAYQLVNLGANYQINEQWQVQVKANNVFDEEYENVLNYNTPDAQYFLNVSYSNF